MGGQITVSASYQSHSGVRLKRLLAVLLCAGCLAGCASTAERGDTAAGAALRKNDCPPGAVLTSYETDQGKYVIRPGDELQIDFYLNSEFNRDTIVRPDGEVSLDVVGAVPAAGLTPEQFAGKLDQAYARELRSPGATVHLKNSPAWRVYVQGQVAHAGAFTLQPGETALQAIAEAGGVYDTGDADSAALIRRDACGNPHYLLSADGDFTGAVEFVRGLTKKVYVACPGCVAQLARVATRFIHLKPDWFRDCYR